MGLTGGPDGWGAEGNSHIRGKPCPVHVLHIGLALAHLLAAGPTSQTRAANIDFVAVQAGLEAAVHEHGPGDALPDVEPDEPNQPDQADQPDQASPAPVADESPGETVDKPPAPAADDPAETSADAPVLDAESEHPDVPAPSAEGLDDPVRDRLGCDTKACRDMTLAGIVVGALSLSAVGTGAGLLANKDEVYAPTPTLVRSTRPAGLVILTIGAAVTVTATLMIVAAHRGYRRNQGVAKVQITPTGLRF